MYLPLLLWTTICSSLLISNSNYATIDQWLCVCIALLIVPSILMTPWFFEKMGVAGTCVFGNSCTAVLTGLLLMIATVFPATTISFGVYVAVMYGGVPLTVFSQLTTGPMLDVIAPADKVGFVQGLNSSTVSHSMRLPSSPCSNTHDILYHTPDEYLRCSRSMALWIVGRCS